MKFMCIDIGPSGLVYHGMKSMDQPSVFNTDHLKRTGLCLLVKLRKHGNDNSIANTKFAYHGSDFFAAFCYSCRPQTLCFSSSNESLLP